jgi:hypothetical protein
MVYYLVFHKIPIKYCSLLPLELHGLFMELNRFFMELHSFSGGAPWPKFSSELSSGGQERLYSNSNLNRHVFSISVHNEKKAKKQKGTNGVSTRSPPR